MVYFWTLFYSIELCSNLSPIPRCLDYYIFTLGLKTENGTLVFINERKREKERQDNSLRRCYNKVQKQDLNPCLSDSSARFKTIFLHGHIITGLYLRQDPECYSQLVTTAANGQLKIKKKIKIGRTLLLSINTV